MFIYRCIRPEAEDTMSEATVEKSLVLIGILKYTIQPE